MQWYNALSEAEFEESGQFSIVSTEHDGNMHLRAVLVIVVDTSGKEFVCSSVGNSQSCCITVVRSMPLSAQESHSNSMPTQIRSMTTTTPFPPQL